MVDVPMLTFNCESVPMAPVVMSKITGVLANIWRPPTKLLIWPREGGTALLTSLLMGADCKEKKLTCPGSEPARKWAGVVWVPVTLLMTTAK